MKKFLIPLFLSFSFLVYTGKAYCAEISAEQHVKKFYYWYISESIKTNDILNSDAIYKYVEHCVVNNIRIFYKRYYYDADYFTKSQDLWKEWLDVLVVHKATKIDDAISIVPISFKLSENVQTNIIVFVQKEKGDLRITKVIGTKLFEN